MEATSLTGNMMLRHDQANGRSLYETFDYDGLQRLTRSTVATGLASPPSLTVGYDAGGNIQHKYVAGAGQETYGYGTLATGCSGLSGAATPGPHAVSTVGSGKRFCYDASGNVIRAFAPDGVRSFAYTPYDLPETLTFSGTNSKVGYEYGPNREKIRRLDYGSAAATSTNDVTHFVGSAEVRVYAGNIQEIRRYLGPVMIEQSRVNNHYRIERRYFLTDAQGSTAAVLSELGHPKPTPSTSSRSPGATAVRMPRRWRSR